MLGDYYAKSFPIEMDADVHIAIISAVLVTIAILAIKRRENTDG